MNAERRRAVVMRGENHSCREPRRVVPGRLPSPRSLHAAPPSVRRPRASRRIAGSRPSPIAPSTARRLLALANQARHAHATLTGWTSMVSSIAPMPSSSADQTARPGRPAATTSAKWRSAILVPRIALGHLALTLLGSAPRHSVSGPPDFAFGDRRASHAVGAVRSTGRRRRVGEARERSERGGRSPHLGRN